MSDEASPPRENRSVSEGAGGRRLSKAKRVLFAAVALALGWLVSEVGGFLAYWVWNGSPFSWSEAQTRRSALVQQWSATSPTPQVHPYAGFVWEPGTETGVVRESDGVRVPVSDFGYIDDKPPLQSRAPGKVVAAVVGGSVACFFAANGTARLEEVLSRSPTFQGKQFVFVNLAILGYKQPQQLTTLAYLLSIGAQFDIVINIDGFNEVALYELENQSRHIHPAFPRSWHMRIGSNDPMLGSRRDRIRSIELERARLARVQSGFPWKYSVLCNMAWQLWDARLDRKVYEIAEEHFKSNQRRRGPYAVTGPAREFASKAELYEFLAEIWSNSSAAIDALCRGEGIRYFHFLQPNQYLPGSKPMDDEEKRTAIMADHPYRIGVETGYPILQRLGETLRRKGVRFHDLTRLFADRPEHVYRDSCCHLNQLGNEVMAEAIAGAILADGLDSGVP
jgi:hypothetical protein